MSLNLEKIVESIVVEVGNGKNKFTMSRGSFNYKQSIEKRKKLVKKDFVKNDENSSQIIFSNPDDKSEISMSIVKAYDMYRFILEIDESKYNRFWITLPAEESEGIYGCGETYSKLNLKGEKVRIWVAEHQNVKRIGTKLIKETLFGKKPKSVKKVCKYESYYVQPTFVSSTKQFVHVNTNSYAEFDFRKKNKTTLYLQGKPDFYIGQENTFEEVSGKIASILGKQKELPDWIYDGAVIAIQEGPEAIDRRLASAEKVGSKICGVWSQDWCGCRKTGFGYQVMWNWEYDSTLYPDLPIKIKEWNKKGVHFLGYINPFMAIEKNLYKYASEKGYCVKDKEGKDYLVTITTFPAAMIDFTNPEAYAWYKSLIKENMIGIGMSGWMADFGEYLPIDSVLFSGEDPEKLHNQWPAIWAKMNKEAIEECGKQKDVFFFTRAGYTQSIDNSLMMWTGDQHVDWSYDDGLAAVIPASLSLAMSGYGITHSDVGGYTTVMNMTRGKELLLRWEEMNVFTPLYRFHEGNQPSRNIQFDTDDELLAQLSKMSNLHAKLKPYLKDCVSECVKNAIPVMRPIFYHYDEEEAYNTKFEYLLGRDILVCPVIHEKETVRDCYIPNDEWVHLLTGKEYKGGHVKVDAPIGVPPVFVRKSSKYLSDLIK